MRSWNLLFNLAFVVVGLVNGYDVLITLPHVTSTTLGKCLFPEVLTVDFRGGPDIALTIPLKRDSVLRPERSVLFMSETAHDGVDEVQVASQMDYAVQAYHNHHHGVAFTVKCARIANYRSYFLLEGSVFVGNHKFRVIPAPLWEIQTRVFPSHVTSIYRMTEIKEFHARDSKVILPLSLSYLMEKAGRPETRSRYKRDVTLPVTYKLDILVVVDSTLYARFYNNSNNNKNLTASNILEYMENLFTAVSMRLSTLELENRTLQIRILAPLLLTNSSQSPYNTSHVQYENGEGKIDATVLLNLFKNWIIRNRNLGAYDHAMFITALNIYGGGDSGIKFNITKGLAYVGTICRTNGESSSIIADRGAYQSEGVVAHELTHGLGSLHDGEQNTCNSADRYIMSDGSYPETNTNSLNPWSFSSCSSRSVLNMLKEVEKNTALHQSCLIDSSGTNTSEFQTISADKQCKLFFGAGSFVCRGLGIPSLDKMCDEFFCRIPGSNICERLTASTGTCCGNQKKCSRGQCIDANQGECSNINEFCPLGDQPGIILNNKTCAQLDSTYCYSDDIYIRCCDTCEKFRLDLQGCNFGNKQLGCVENDCGSYIEDGEYKGLPYDFVCCGTCKQQCSDINNVELLNGAKYTCSDYILNQGNKVICYQKKFLEDSCCRSCEDARDVTNEGCLWGDRENCSSLWKKPPGYNCTASQLQGCCYTCPMLMTRTATNATATNATATNATATPAPTPVKHMVTSCTKPCNGSINVTNTSVLCLMVVLYSCLIKWLFN